MLVVEVYPDGDGDYKEEHWQGAEDFCQYVPASGDHYESGDWEGYVENRECSFCEEGGCAGEVEKVQGPFFVLGLGEYKPVHECEHCHCAECPYRDIEYDLV